MIKVLMTLTFSSFNKSFEQNNAATPIIDQLQWLLTKDKKEDMPHQAHIYYHHMNHQFQHYQLHQDQHLDPQEPPEQHLIHHHTTHHQRQLQQQSPQHKCYNKSYHDVHQLDCFKNLHDDNKIVYYHQYRAASFGEDSKKHYSKKPNNQTSLTSSSTPTSSISPSSSSSSSTSSKPFIYRRTKKLPYTRFPFYRRTKRPRIYRRTTTVPSDGLQVWVPDDTPNGEILLYPDVKIKPEIKFNPDMQLYPDVLIPTKAPKVGLVPDEFEINFHRGKVNSFESPVDQLEVPEGFAIMVYALVEDARCLLALPGDLVLVSQPMEGTITLLKPGLNSSVEVSEFATGLQEPNDMVFYDDGEGNSYLYIAESNKIARYPYNKKDMRIGKAQVLVADLPDNTEYGYSHYLKNIAVGKDTLYVSIGSTSNADPTDLASDPKSGAIYGYSLTGKNRRLISEGIRNAEGLAFAPGTKDLWIVNNQRDNVKYPYVDDTGNYGQIIADYVDENPAEEFTKVEEGKNYGWPYCNPVPSDSMDDLDYVPDVDNNENETVVNCSTFRRVDKGIQAHSAPLGLTFWTGANVDEKYRDGALVAMHGSWNRESSISGNKVSFFPWVGGRPGNEVDLVTGWVIGRERWGRPVDVAVLEDGSVLISDDTYGAIYKLYKNIE
uniref:Pyrroloquinoline quinone-dependent pyranose dehydrogenase beta-propeller domain-containing protein n=1 Tax=Strigamia maritima TaxID=126957 RepID=T1IYJ6_STRMM